MNHSFKVASVFLLSDRSQIVHPPKAVLMGGKLTKFKKPKTKGNIRAKRRRWNSVIPPTMPGRETSDRKRNSPEAFS